MTALTVNNRDLIFLKKIYDILVFLNFLNLLQKLQCILSYLDSTENIFNIILPLLLYSLGENKFVYSHKPLPFNMKSINGNTKVSTLY